MASALNLNSVVSRSPGQVSSDLDGEEVILNLESGVYYGLDAVGARIWSLIKQPCTVASICDVILAEYDVESERCRQDVLALLSQLAEAKLVEVHAQGTDVAASDDQ